MSYGKRHGKLPAASTFVRMPSKKSLVMIAPLGGLGQHAGGVWNDTDDRGQHVGDVIDSDWFVRTVVAHRSRMTITRCYLLTLQGGCRTPCLIKGLYPPLDLN